MARIGTRGSRLALAQTGWVVERLRALTPGETWETVVIATAGDQSGPDRPPLGTGVFVKEIERALLEGAVDLAVHSLKDLPTDPSPGLTIAAVPERADPRDALVGATLDALAPGAKVGTGSPRRAAQLRRLRPDVAVVPIRGNIPTRLRKVEAGEVAAAMVAAAALARLGLPADQLFKPDAVLPAPGQGALALQTREGEWLATFMATLDHIPTRTAVDAERAVLRELGGGCMLPVATYGRVLDGSLVLEASVTSPDGTRQAWGRAEGDPSAPAELGAIVAKLLLDRGAAELLETEHA